MLSTTEWIFNKSGALGLLIIVDSSSLVLFVRELYFDLNFSEEDIFLSVKNP